MTRRKLLGSLVLVAGSPLLSSIANPASATSALAPIKTSVALDDTSVFWSCWIGHSTILIRAGTKWILTDPVMFDAYGVSVFGKIIGPQRVNRPAMSVDECPKPDLILLSHAHIDHMDRTTLFALSEKYPNQIDVITATNTRDVIDDLKWRSLNEMDWGDKVSVHGIEIEGVRVKHNGWRWPGEACRAGGQHRTGRSYNGYHLNANGVRVMFGGDTAYTTEFARYKNKVDVAYMPIGAYMGCNDLHCTPEEALAMTQMMNAHHMIPIHHATFNQTGEPMSEPLKRLESVLHKGIDPLLAARHVGDTLGLT